MLQLFKIFFLFLLQLVGSLFQLIIQRPQSAVDRRQAIFGGDIAHAQRFGDGFFADSSQGGVGLSEERVEQTKKLWCRQVQLLAQVVNVFALKIDQNKTGYDQFQELLLLFMLTR